MTISDWEARQRQLPDGAVESEQRVRVDAPVVRFDRDGAAALGDSYWRVVSRATCGLVRPRRRGDGLELRLLGRRPILLSFGAPVVAANPEKISCAYSIRGGLLARRAAGELTFEQISDGQIVLRSAISGFYPSLAAREGRRSWTGALYTSVQSRIHVAISRRYFERLAVRAP